MSSRTNRHTKMHPAAATMIGIVTAAAVLASGFAMFPPASASASRPHAVVLGVDEATAVVIGPKIPIGEKLGGLTESVEATTHAWLIAPSQKRKAKVVKTPASESRVSKHAQKDKSGSPKRRAKKSEKRSDSKSASSSGWKKAKASWYGPGLYGNGMAGGGKLKRNSMVVAHRTLPFGTKLKIKYRGKSVTATVKDRGPFIKGRIFDLGPGTAKALGFDGVGTISYKIIR